MAGSLEPRLHTYILDWIEILLTVVGHEPLIFFLPSDPQEEVYSDWLMEEPCRRVQYLVFGSPPQHKSRVGPTCTHQAVEPHATPLIMSCHRYGVVIMWSAGEGLCLLSLAVHRPVGCDRSMKCIRKNCDWSYITLAMWPACGEEYVVSNAWRLLYVLDRVLFHPWGKCKKVTMWQGWTRVWSQVQMHVLHMYFGG